MKIETTDFSRYHNEEHFQFGEDFATLVNQKEAVKLKIEPQFELFKIAHDKEKQALERIKKSTATTKLMLADTNRDNTLLGIKHLVNAALVHYDPTVRNIAQKTKIILDTYGDIARKNYSEETGAITNLIEELKKNPSDTQIVGLTSWTNELARQNNIVQELLLSRDAEFAGLDDTPVKTVRAHADEAYRIITERLEARTVLDPDDDLTAFINSLNALVGRYNLTIAQRTGRSAAKKDENTETKKQ